MIALRDHAGNTLNASVVLETGEKAVLVKLTFGTSDVDTLRITNPGRATSDLTAWGTHHNLTDESVEALKAPIQMEVKLMESHQQADPMVTMDWPGSRSARRAPARA